MALYLKAAGGNWSAAGTWSATGSGGADSAGPPTSSTDVIMEAGSGNVTIDATAACRSIDCTSGTGDYAGGITHNAGINLNIGDGTAGVGNVALKFSATTGYSKANATVPINFVSTSTTQQTIDFQGLQMGSVIFNGSGGKWQLTNGYTQQSTGVTQLLAGTLDTNNQTLTWGSFNAANAGVHTLTMGSSSITVLSGSTAWNQNNIINHTFTANTATITFTGSNVTNNWPNINLNGASIVASGAGFYRQDFGGTKVTITVANFTRTGTATKSDSLQLDDNLICTGTFTCNGNSTINRMLVQTVNIGSASTITAATVSVSNSDFMDITGAGAGSWDLSAITGLSGDCGGNSGITFTTAATQTATMSTNNNWTTAAIWTSRVPLPQDDVSLAGVTGGQLITNGMPRLGRDIDWTGATGNPTWAINISSFSIFGSITLISGMTVSGTNTMSLQGRSSHTITSAGRTFTTPFTLAAFGGTYTLQDALLCDQSFNLNNGTFISNSFTITSSTFSSGGAGVARVLTLGTTTWNLTNTSATTVWSNTSSSGFTLSAASSTLVISTVSANTRTISPSNMTLGTLTYTLAGSTGKLTIGNNNNTFTGINFSDITNARTLEFTAGTTQTFTTSFNVQGTAGKLMLIQSATAASHTLSMASGIVVCDYLSISRSTAQGGATWYAGSNSTDGGNNSGWLFTSPSTYTHYSLSDSKYQWYVTRSGLSLTAPIGEHMKAYFRSKGITGNNKTPFEMEKEWLAKLTGVTSTNYAMMWHQAVSGQGKTPTASLNQNQFIFYSQVTGNP